MCGTKFIGLAIISEKSALFEEGHDNGGKLLVADSPVQTIDADAKYTRIAEAGEARLAATHQEAEADRQ